MRLIVCFVTLFFIPFVSFANWSVINTGINDDFNGVWFWGQKGVLTGDKGIYYTLNGGNLPGDWTRFKITSNSQDSIIYERSKFYKISTNTNNVAYIAATDTVVHKGMVFKIDLTNLTYAFEYIGPANSSLKWIEVNNSFKLTAAGDGGFGIYGQYGSYNIINLNTSENITGVVSNGQIVFFVSDSSLYTCIDSLGILNIIERHNFSGQRKFRGACYFGSTVYTADSKLNFITATGFMLNGVDKFDLGVLNANDVSQYLVATDHGIFRNYNNEHLEYFPSLVNFNVNDVLETTGYAYAACDSGYFLRLAFPYNYSKPYAQMDLTINCLGQNCIFQSVPSSATSYTWTVNGTTVGNTGSINNYTFNSIGQYTISLLASNAGPYYDTVTSLITVVDTPSVICSVDISDSILCHSEAIDVLIGGSQSDFNYFLHKPNSSTEFGSSVGQNDSTIIHTIQLDSAGTYFITAYSSVSQCQATLIDSIKLRVEKTKAKVHCSYINTEINEPTLFFGKVVDANHFFWDFDTLSNTQFSSIAEPVVSFGTLGVPQIKLKVWSDNNCYDSTTFNGLFVYQNANNLDTCWAFNLKGDAIETLPFSLKANSNGVLFGGNYKNQHFPSTIGNELFLSDSGAYVAKYNDLGVLKWVTYSMGDHWDYPRDYVYDLTVDKNDNIYFTGTSYGKYYFNNGDSMTLFYNRNTLYANHITKMDSLGRLVFSKFLNLQAHVSRISVDQENTISVSGMEITDPNQANISIDSCNYVVDSTNIIYFNHMPNGDNAYILLLDSLGNYTNLINLEFDAFTLPFWICRGENKSTYSTISDVVTFGVGKNGIHQVTIYPAPNDASNPIYCEEAHVLKFDSIGNLLWDARFRSPVSCSGMWYGGIDLSAIVSDNDGNIYVSANNLYSSNLVYQFGNNDTVLFQHYDHFIAKIDKNGQLMWVNGIDGYGGSSLDINYEERSNTVRAVFSTSNSPLISFYQQPGAYNYISSSTNFDDVFIVDYDTLGNLLSASRVASSSSGGGFYHKYPRISTNKFGTDFLSLGSYWPSVPTEPLYGSVFCDIVSVSDTYDQIIGGGKGETFYAINVYEKKFSKMNENIFVFPNPVPLGDEINIKLNKPGFLSIFSILGEIIFSNEVNDVSAPVKFSGKNLGPGLYNICFTDHDGSSQTAKFIVEK